MYEGKELRNMHAHGSINLNISLRTVFKFCHYANILYESCTLFIHETPATYLLLVWALSRGQFILRDQPGTGDPDNIAPKIMEVLRLLHHVNVAILGRGGFAFISRKCFCASNTVYPTCSLTTLRFCLCFNCSNTASLYQSTFACSLWFDLSQCCSQLDLNIYSFYKDCSAIFVWSILCKENKANETML